MGRGKIEIKKIENPTSRQVTFSKRRGGLIKKASELAVLCDAEIAVIIFSSTGKLFEFSSNGGMKQILERYSKNADGVQTGRISDNSDYMSREVMKLRQQLEHSQHSQRQMLGEDLAVLNVHDLLQLEQQLDVGVNRVRQRRSQLLMEEIEELRRKVFERELHEENEDLRRKLVDAKGIADAAARGVPGLNSNLQSPNARSEPAATQPVPQVYPLQPNLRDPQPASQPSLQLGLFAPSRSRGPAHQNSGAETEAGSRHGEWMSQ